MRNFEKHIIHVNQNLKDAIGLLNQLKSDAILFVVNNDFKLFGSVTDGDIRRALLKNKNLNSCVSEVIEDNPVCIESDKIQPQKIKYWRENNFKIIPVVDKNSKIIGVLNFNVKKTILPVHCVIMAGGKGERLRPLTEKTPKPLLKVGNKPILDHTLDHFQKFGLKYFSITTNYLSPKIEEFIASKTNENIDLNCIKEPSFMGTIGSLKLIDNWQYDMILLSNSDLLTNVNLESFYIEFEKSNADCTVLGVEHQVDIPYGVLNHESNKLTSISEKPTYSYFTNGGMYLIKKSMLDFIPSNQEFTAVQFIENLIKNDKKVMIYKHFGYWKDIGSHADFEQAQIDSKFVFESN